MSIVIMLLLISVLIIAHELGHFLVARKCGIKVERFGFGLPFGPTLWSKKIGDVEYCIHAALFGGYVAFPDDNPDSDLPADSKARFENQPILNRFAVMIAGVAVNAVMGWLIMMGVIMNWGLPSIDVTVGEVLDKQSPAVMAGLLNNDVIRKIDGREIQGYFAQDRLLNTVQAIQHHAGKTVTMDVVRDGKPQQVKITPNAEGKIGIRLGGVDKYIPVSSPIVAGDLSFRFLSNFVVLNFQAMGKMVSGQVKASELSGPVMIVKTGAQLIDKQGIEKGLMLTAIISVILAVMNLLPIPALDGGHILFLIIEAIKGSPVKKEIQEGFTQVGFVGLLMLMGFILFNDINNAFINPITLPF